MEFEMEWLNADDLNLHPLIDVRVGTLAKAGGIVLAIRYAPIRPEGEIAEAQSLNLALPPDLARELGRQLLAEASGHPGVPGARAN
jgi:hypothetical protein